MEKIKKKTSKQSSLLCVVLSTKVEILFVAKYCFSKQLLVSDGSIAKLSIVRIFYLEKAKSQKKYIIYLIYLYKIFDIFIKVNI